MERALRIFIFCLSIFFSFKQTNACLAYDKRIAAVSSHGNNCDIIGFDDDTFFWYKCIRIKDDGTMITDLHLDQSSKNITKQDRFMVDKIKERNLLDIFTPYDKDANYDNKVYAKGGIQLKGTELKCFVHVSSQIVYYNGPELGINLDTVSNTLTGFDIADDRYSIMSYTNFTGKYIAILDKGKTVKIEETEDDIQAITYYGKGRNGNPRIAMILNPYIKIYELQGMELIQMDMRMKGMLTGCPQSLCSEGMVDNVFSLSETDENIYITRNNHIYRINAVGGDIETTTPFKSQALKNASAMYNHQRVHGCDTKIVIYSNDGDYRIGCVQEHRRMVVFNTSEVDRNVLFKDIPSTDEIFASFRTSVDKKIDNYYIFASDSVYHYRNERKNDFGSNIHVTLTLIKSFKIKDRFHKLWTTFDAAWKNPKKDEVYFFKNDFNIKYDWNEDGGLLKPMSNDPMLNMKSFWSCKNLDLKMLNETAYKYRYTPLESDGKKSNSWLIPLVIAAVLLIVLLIVLIFCVIRRRRRSSQMSNPMTMATGSDLKTVNSNIIKKV